MASTPDSAPNAPPAQTPPMPSVATMDTDGVTKRALLFAIAQQIGNLCTGSRNVTNATILPIQASGASSPLGAIATQIGQLVLASQYGGTGRGDLGATNGVMIYEGAYPVNFAYPISSGYVLTDNGTGNDPSFQQPSGAQLKGTTTNNNASAGNVGEFINSTVAWGSSVSFTSGNVLGLTSISLTAGDWDVWGSVFFYGGATTTVSVLACSIGTVSGSLNQTAPTYGEQNFVGATIFADGAQSVPCGPARFSLASTTTIYLNGYTVFGTSTCVEYASSISARRVR
jgi:hypothetical protein